MGYEREYMIDHTNEKGYEPCDILVRHYKSDNFRTIVIAKDDLVPWKIVSALNSAYDAGRKDAMRDLRYFMGIEK